MDIKNCGFLFDSYCFNSYNLYALATIKEKMRTPLPLNGNKSTNMVIVSKIIVKYAHELSCRHLANTEPCICLRDFIIYV